MKIYFYRVLIHETTYMEKNERLKEVHLELKKEKSLNLTLCLNENVLSEL